jgi:hypothetical protein
MFLPASSFTYASRKATSNGHELGGAPKLSMAHKPVRAAGADGVSKGGGGKECIPRKTMQVSAGGHGAIRPGCSDGRSTTAKNTQSAASAKQANRKNQEPSRKQNNRYEFDSL